MTLWTNALTGRRLERSELTALRRRAHSIYVANTHIFQDELEALFALGAVPARHQDQV